MDREPLTEKTSDPMERLRLLGRSSIVGADVKWAVDEIERLRALAGPSGKSLHELEAINDGLLAENQELRRRLRENLP